jgi:hypothetical protein
MNAGFCPVNASSWFRSLFVCHTNCNTKLMHHRQWGQMAAFFCYYNNGNGTIDTSWLLVNLM